MPEPAAIETGPKHPAHVWAAMHWAQSRAAALGPSWKPEDQLPSECKCAVCSKWGQVQWSEAERCYSLGYGHGPSDLVDRLIALNTPAAISHQPSAIVNKNLGGPSKTQADVHPEPTPPQPASSASVQASANQQCPKCAHMFETRRWPQ